MPKEHTPDSKFQVRNVGELMHPGSCMSCGSGNRVEGYVDLATWFDYEGQMYLCKYCVEEIAEVMGCLTEVEADAIQAANLELLAENAKLKDKISELDSRLSGIDQYLAPLAAAVSTVMASETVSESESSADVSVNEGESKSAEPVKVTGSNDTPRSARGNSGSKQPAGLSI